MGMFDYIKIEDQIDLPKPENFEFDDLEFQTKSLDCTMNTYIIANDRFLYKENTFQENSKRTKVEFHGTIDFGSYEQTDLVDHILDYRAKFTDGTLTEIKLIKYETQFHESIKQKLENIKAKQKKYNNRLCLRLQRLLVYPLNILGLNLSSNSLGEFRNKNCYIGFYCPKIVFNCGKTKGLEEAIYGFRIDALTTDISFYNSKTLKEISFRILGFGIVFKFLKEFNFESLHRPV